MLNTYTFIYINCGVDGRSGGGWMACRTWKKW